MAGSSIFVTYGLKSGGGAPFLKRTRNAFGQLQRRTKTASNVNQLQTRTRSCNCSTSGFVTAGYNLHSCGWNSPYTCVTSSCTASSFISTCNWSDETGFTNCPNTPGHNVPLVTLSGAFCHITTTCSLSGFSTFTNTSSCNAFSTSCNSNGIKVRQCQTVTQCQFPANFTDWTDDGGCVAANPACSNGAVIRQCQTVFSFREQDWSPFEEADECITSSPTATQGAVAVECIAN